MSFKSLLTWAENVKYSEWSEHYKYEDDLEEGENISILI